MVWVQEDEMSNWQEDSIMAIDRAALFEFINRTDRQPVPGIPDQIRAVDGFFRCGVAMYVDLAIDDDGFPWAIVTDPATAMYAQHSDIYGHDILPLLATIEPRWNAKRITEIQIRFGAGIADIIPTCARAVDTFGEAAQTDMVIEECTELVNALVKLKRGRGAIADVADECADVIIMAMQLVYMTGAPLVGRRMEYKIGRLKARLDAKVKP